MSAPRLGWEPIPSRQAPGWLQQQRGPRGHSQGVIWVLGEAEAAPAPLRSGRALTLELAGCCLEAGIWCSEAILSWAVCFCGRSQTLKLAPRILLALSPWPWGRAPCPHPVPAAAEPHRGAQRTEQRGPRLPHISPGAAAAPSPSLALHGPGPCSELFTGQSPRAPWRGPGDSPSTEPPAVELRRGSAWSEGTSELGVVPGRSQSIPDATSEAFPSVPTQ